MKIQKVLAYWVLDSRGRPTVCCEITSDKGLCGRAMVPSGASTGSHEVLELRDGGKEFNGLGVNKAVTNILHMITPAIIKKKFDDPSEIEAIMLELDGTENKSIVGANALLAVSMAIYRLFALHEGLQLAEYISDLHFRSRSSTPRLMANILNGGVHADNTLDVQEFMVIPKFHNLSEDIRIIAEIYAHLKRKLQLKKLSIHVGDEGGFAPQIKDTRTALKYITETLDELRITKKVDIGLDCAATEWYDPISESYTLEGEEYDARQLVDWYEDIIHDYPLASIEDPMSEDDINGWQYITDRLGKKRLIVGDDYFVTSASRFMNLGIEQKTANAILIKPNQIGTVGETIETIKLAQKYKYSVIISHRSGETEDSFIADLAIASSAEFIKLGAPARGERTAKYNRLLELFHNS